MSESSLWFRSARDIFKIVIPLIKIKIVAYAGLFFDLIGATSSNICVDGLQPGIAFMLLPFTIGGLSYMYYHKRLSASVS